MFEVRYVKHLPLDINTIGADQKRWEVAGEARCCIGGKRSYPPIAPQPLAKDQTQRIEAARLFWNAAQISTAPRDFPRPQKTKPPG
jgi:hypothetical protein